MRAGKACAGLILGKSMDLQARADHLAQIIEEKLGVRGTGLETKLKRAGRRLPKHIRTQGALLVEALRLEGHPKLSQRADPARLERAFADIERYLSALDPSARRRANVLDWLAGQAFSFFVLAILAIALLRWQGFL